MKPLRALAIIHTADVFQDLAGVALIKVWALDDHLRADWPQNIIRLFVVSRIDVVNLAHGVE